MHSVRERQTPTFEWTPSPRQHNAFAETSTLKWGKNKIVLGVKKHSFLASLPKSFNSYIDGPNHFPALTWRSLWRLWRLPCSMDVLVICSVRLRPPPAWSADIIRLWGDAPLLMLQHIWCGLWREGGGGRVKNKSDQRKQTVAVVTDHAEHPRVSS